MNTRSSRLKARHGDDGDDAPVEVIDDCIAVYDPKKKTKALEIITLDEEDDAKTAAARVKPEVECIDDDVITLEDEEDEVLCLEETKAAAPAASSGQNKEPRVSGQEKPGRSENAVADRETRTVVTRRQRVLRETDPNPGKSVNINSAKQPTISETRQIGGRKDVDVRVEHGAKTVATSQKETGSVVLTRRLKALEHPAESEESILQESLSVTRQDKTRDKDRSEAKNNVVGSVPTKRGPRTEPASKQAPNVKNGNRRVGVKQEPVQPKMEREVTPATVTTWEPLTTSVMVPKSEQTTSDATTTVVVKTQPPEQEVMEVETPAAQSRLGSVPAHDKDDDDGEVEGGPEHVRKLFIGRMDRRTTHDSLKRYFERWGKIVDICLPTDRITKRSRGFAFITFSKARMVDAVQKARPHTVDGRILDPKRAVPRWESHLPQAKITVKTVFLYGLKGQITERDLEEYFRSFGKVIRCRIVQRRGFGFVEFDDYDPVDKIFLQKVHRICGKSVGADKAMGKQHPVNSRNMWQHYNRGMRNGYNTQSWTGVNPRGSQYSRRFEPYYRRYEPYYGRFEPYNRADGWRSYGGLARGYQSHVGGGPVRSYYTQRHSPYSSPATWSANQHVGYNRGSADYTRVVVNWSTSSTRRNVSNSAQDSSLWGSRSYSSINISHTNTSQTADRNRTLRGLFAFPVPGISQTYNYSTGRR